MTVQPTDIIRASAKMVILGQLQENVYHYRYSPTGFAMDDSEAVSTLLNGLEGFYGEISDLQSEDLAYASVDFFNVSQASPMGEYPWPTLEAGALTDFVLALQLAAVLRFPTSVTRTQGRKFIGGMCESAVDSYGYIETVVLASLGLIAATMWESIGTGSNVYAPGVYNYTLDRFTRYGSATVNTIMGTQRRRQIGRGA
jgi:hypothetical protein